MLESKLPDAWVKALQKGALIEQSWNRNQSLILIGFQAPPVDDEDEPAIAVLEKYFGGEGRVSQALVEKMGAAPRIFADYHPRMRGGSFILGAVTSPDTEETVYKALCEEIRKVASEPISYRDFRSAVNAATGDYGFMMEPRHAQIVHIFQNMLTGKGISGFQSFAMNVARIQEEDLSEAVEKILVLDKAVTVRMHGRKKQ
jgi:predicted Zn-dependent peptidase